MPYNIFKYYEIKKQSTLSAGKIDKVKMLLYSYCYVYISFFFIAFIIIMPLDKIVVKILGQESILATLKSSYQNPQYFTFLNVVVLAPLVEEIIFRLFLDFKKNSIVISLIFAVYFVIGGRFSFENLYNITNLYRLFFSLVISFLYLKVFSKYEFCIRPKFKIYICTCSIVIFGLTHLQNLDSINYKLLVFYPFFVLPQIIMAYFISNIRLKQGFFWGVLLHSMINFTFYICH